MNSQKIYQENAFRILGVFADSSRTAVRDIHQSLRIRARVGGLGSVSDPLSFLDTIERSESSIRDAFNKLEDPKSRLRERLFWFSGSTSVDNEAIARLTAKDMQGAVHHWESAEDIGSNANLARLYHAFCITRDPDAGDLRLWATDLTKWRAILENDEFWAQFVDLELESEFEPLATMADIDALREEAWTLVIDASRVLAQEAIDSQRNEIARRHLDWV